MFQLNFKTIQKPLFFRKNLKNDSKEGGNRVQTPLFSPWTHSQGDGKTYGRGGRWSILLTSIREYLRK